MHRCIVRQEVTLNRTGCLAAATRQGQRGAIGLVLMVMIGLLIGLLVIGYARNVRGNDVVDPQTIMALSKAREALLGYATTYRDTHTGEGFGYFPCPDMGSGTEGQSASACGATDVSVIGRLPWKTLDLAPLRDASGECLWYAISGNYKNNPKTNDLVNHDTNGLIEVMAADGSGFIAGAMPPQRAVAVIFAPGAILPGQDRTLAATNPPSVCGGNYDPANYLDTDAASGVDNAAAASVAHALTRFIAAEHSDATAASNDAFNDQLMVILPDDVFARHVERRNDFEAYLTDPLTGMLRRSADCLAFYGGSNGTVFGAFIKQLPWTAPIDVGSFGSATQYGDASNTLSGRLPRAVPVSAAAWPFPNATYATTPLLVESVCPGWNDVDEFWNTWKDHLFYAVGRAHQPDAFVSPANDPCNFDECIDVQDPDGIKTNMAAVVIFSGARLPGQDRNNDANPSYASTDKANPANYLEGANVTAIQSNPAGPPNRLFTKTVGNDTVMCLVTLPSGSSSELFVDPTCGTSGRCITDGGLLAAYRAGSTNNCRVGTSGLAAACETIARNIDINNCPGDGTTFDSMGQPYSCERGARDFVSYECLQGITSARCQLAHTALTNCQ